MEDQLSQQEVEHEANAVRNDYRERRPWNRRHTAPRCVGVNIAGEKKVSAAKRAARETDQGPEVARPLGSLAHSPYTIVPFLPLKNHFLCEPNTVVSDPQREVAGIGQLNLDRSAL